MNDNAIRYWNAVLLEADRATHTERHRDEAAVQGPLGSSRAFAIVHLAMHDAFFGIRGGQRTYLTPGTRPDPAPNLRVAEDICGTDLTEENAAIPGQAPPVQH